MDAPVKIPVAYAITHSARCLKLAAGRLAGAYFLGVALMLSGAALTAIGALTTIGDWMATDEWTIMESTSKDASTQEKTDVFIDALKAIPWSPVMVLLVAAGLAASFYGLQLPSAYAIRTAFQAPSGYSALAGERTAVDVHAVKSSRPRIRDALRPAMRMAAAASLLLILTAVVIIALIWAISPGPAMGGLMVIGALLIMPLVSAWAAAVGIGSFGWSLNVMRGRLIQVWIAVAKAWLVFLPAVVILAAIPVVGWLASIVVQMVMMASHGSILRVFSDADDLGPSS